MPVNIIKAAKAAKQSSLAKKLLASALAYAGLGLRVFPLKTATNDQPLITAWPQKATCDTQRIKEWWAATPEANVAIACGIESNLIVVDVDMKHGKNGKATMSELFAEHGAFETRTAASPTGGRHYYFKSPGFSIANRAGFVSGVNFRGDGGYIVAPPSIRDEGTYVWENNTELAVCPDWLLKLIQKKESKPSKSDSFNGEKVMAGSRNIYLASLAGAMRHHGAFGEAILPALQAQNKIACDPPLDEDEVAKIAASISKYAPAGLIVPVVGR